MGVHLIDDEFQSDKYPTTPRGKVPLSVKDKTAQDLLWEYAQRRRVVDSEFSEDLQRALLIAGYRPLRTICLECRETWFDDVTTLNPVSMQPPPLCSDCRKPCTGGHWVERRDTGDSNT